MKSDDCQDFFINEIDMWRYYKEFILEYLNHSLVRNEPTKAKIKNTYDVCRNILKEYFGNITTNRIFQFLDDPI